MEDMQKNILEEQVMQRVYLMWFGRYVRESRLVRLVALLLFLAVARIWVSFGDILHNMQSLELTKSAISKYAAIAFLSTEPVVQVITVLLAFLAILFMVDAGKIATRGFRHEWSKKKSTQTKNTPSGVFFVDPGRIELPPQQCECRVIPLYYGPVDRTIAQS